MKRPCFVPLSYGLLLRGEGSVVGLLGLVLRCRGQPLHRGWTVDPAWSVDTYTDLSVPGVEGLLAAGDAAAVPDLAAVPPTTWRCLTSRRTAHSPQPTALSLCRVQWRSGEQPRRQLTRVQESRKSRSNLG
jgi:hypothetical protein